MENISNTRHNPHTVHRPQLKKKSRYNDSLKKYKKTMSNLAQKAKNIYQGQNQDETDFSNSKIGLNIIPTELREKETPSNSNIIKKYDWTTNKRVSLSAPKYHFLKASTPKRNYNLRRKDLLLNTPKDTNYSTYLKTTNDFNEFNEGERRNKASEILSTSFRTTLRTKSRPNLRPLLAYNDFSFNPNKSSANNDINNLTINNSSSFNSVKSKEIITLNNILQKQNKELRQRTREMRYKINDLLNNIKLIRLDNQRLNSEKNKLLMKITNLENELDISKNMSLNELESKSNIITQLNEEIMKLNAALDEKENEIINLTNNINDNNYNNGNNINNQYNNGKQIYNNNNKNIDIMELDDDTINNNIKNDDTNIDIDALRKLNNNDLINQIINLKNEIKNLKYENEKNELENKNLNTNLLDNNDKLFKNNERINNLIQENQKYRKLCIKFKNENEKMKNYMSHLRAQKISFDNQQKEYQKNINDLAQKLNLLKDENGILKNIINNSGLKDIAQNHNINNENNNVDNQLLIQLDQLIKENNSLKTQLNQNNENIDKNNFKGGNNIGNNFQEINYLKNDIEEKTIEINNLQDKMKSLVNELNSYKNNNEDLSKNNTQLKQELAQLNTKISNLENENFNNQQQIIDLSNTNNKLTIQLNAANHDTLPSFNNTVMNNGNQDNEELEQQIMLLQQKNEELEEQLNNNLNNETNNTNQINKILLEKNNLLKENTELKNELLSLKNNMNDLEDENHNNALEMIKIKDLEMQLEKAKNECELNFKELKIKQNENQKLLNVIKSKEKENIELQNELANNYGGGADHEFDDGGNNFNIQLNEEIEELKREIEEKKEQIDKLEKEINNYKAINNKILQENTQLKEKIQLIQSGQDEGLIITIDNLKDELKDKALQIQKLIEENNSLRNNINNNKKDEEREIDLNNNNGNEHNPFRNTVNSTGLNDADKIKLYKEQIKEYKMTNESDKIQIKTLKEDIKMMKEKIKNLETFGGQVKNMAEFNSILSQALLNYNPKKKEQKDALNKIVNILNNNQV